MKKMWILSILTFLMVFTAGVMFAGAQAEAKVESGELTVGAQAWMLEKFRLDDAAKKFMVDHPQIDTKVTKVEHADTTSYILQWSSGKTSVDIAIGGSREQAVQYVPRDLVIDFDNGFFDDTLRREDFIPAFLELGNIEGKQYMIPMMGEVMYIVVRKDYMREAGLVDANDKVIPAKTWDELYEYAKKLTKKDGNTITRLGLGIDWGYDFIHYTYLACLQGLNGTIYEAGTNKIDFTSANAKKLVEVWAKLVKDGFSTKDVFADTNAARTHFKSGNVAMHLTAHSRLNEYADLLGKDRSVSCLSPVRPRTVAWRSSMA